MDATSSSQHDSVVIRRSAVTCFNSAKVLSAALIMKRSRAASAVLTAMVIVSTSSCGGANRDAGNLGTRVCVQNESSVVASMAFTKRDTARGEGVLESGTQACGEGTFLIGDDVTGVITLAAPLSEVNVTASNPWAGAPEARMYMNGRWCAGGSMSVGDSSLWDDGVVLYKVERIADGQWKEFVVTLRDSASPSPNGKPVLCPDGSRRIQEL